LRRTTAYPKMLQSLAEWVLEQDPTRLFGFG
jgi:hypothetical protein